MMESRRLHPCRVNGAATSAGVRLERRLDTSRSFARMRSRTVFPITGTQSGTQRVMNDLPTSAFERAIRATHGANARLLRREHVLERFEGKTVWIGEVLVFELFDHPDATRCYAWEVNGQVTAVLGVPPVDSAQTAVRAAIVGG